MIKDLDLIKDIRPLMEKSIIIWGMGRNGHVLLKEITDMRRNFCGRGYEQGEIILCDSDRELRKKKIEEYEIISPQDLFLFFQRVDASDYIVCLSMGDIYAQDEVLKRIDEMKIKNLTVYTWYALKFGIYFNVNHACISETYRTDKLTEYKKLREERKQFIGSQQDKSMRYFIYVPLHNDEIILIYQPGKVGSSSLKKSLESYGKYVLHCHTLMDMEYGEDTLKKLINQKSGKIISLVRDPLARQISNMWQNMEGVYRYSLGADFNEVEDYYFNGDFENYEFKWFESEIEKKLGINIYEYPFDREKGYCKIKKENIELLLIKMEKLNELEQVIGDFLHIDGFQIISDNIGNEKPYRFAYSDYKKRFSVSEETLKRIYYENEYVKHFYTKQEREDLYLKWQKNAVNEFHVDGKQQKRPS